MELTEVGTIAASGGKRILTAAGTVEVTASQTLKIETSPGGAEVLSEECPDGKVWDVTISVTVEEMDA